MEKSSKIKLRLLEVAKNKGISYEKFFEEFGTTYANFKGKSLKSSLRSEVLVDFSSIHPEVDLNWIITGENKNIIKSKLSNEPKAEYGNGSAELIQQLKKDLEHKEELLKAKEETIYILKNQLGIKEGNSKAG